MQFNQVNNKLRTVFDTLKGNDANLKSKANDELLLQFFKQSMKPIFVLEDTGWLSKKPTRIDGSKTTTTRGTFLAESLEVNFTQDILLPEFLLPYVDVLTFVKAPPDTHITTYEPYVSSLLSGVTMRVSSGGVAYVGAVIDDYIWFEEDELDDYQIPIGRTKKIWQVVLTYTDNLGDDWRVTGRLLYINVQSPAGSGCDGNPDSQWDSFRIRAYEGDNTDEFFAEKNGFDKYATFDEVTTSSITGKGNLVEVRSVSDGGGGCQIEVTENPETTTSVNPFPSGGRTKLLIDGLIEKKISGNFIPQTLGQVRYDLFPVNNPQFTSAEFLGYVPHYTTDHDGRIQTNGSALDLILNSYPETPGHTITLEKNPDGYPTGVASFNDMAGASGMQNRKNLVFFKLEDTADERFAIYRMKYDTDIPIMSPALLDYDTPYIRYQNSTYAHNGTAYNRSSNEVDFKTERTYMTVNQDVQYKIMLVVRNPLVYQEIRKYDTSQ